MERDGTEPPTILVVDDEVEVGDMMVRMIRRLLLASTVGAVLSAVQAIDVLLVQGTDVVLTDLRMPGMDGAQLTQIIKTRWPTTRVIIFSGSTDQALNEVTRRVQADAYLTKPFSRDELAAVLLPLLEKRQ
jgi:two-component system, response regulator YesN